MWTKLFLSDVSNCSKAEVCVITFYSHSRLHGRMQVTVRVKATMKFCSTCFLFFYSSLSFCLNLLTISPTGAGYLDNVALTSARRGPGTPARWVEKCTCPQGYVGQHCEQCALGYRRANPELGLFSPCERCNCNGHSDTCDPVTGQSHYRMVGFVCLIDLDLWRLGFAALTGLCFCDLILHQSFVYSFNCAVAVYQKYDTR